MADKNGEADGIISLQKGDLFTYLREYREERINIVLVKGHEGGLAIMAGKKEFDELDQMRMDEMCGKKQKPQEETTNPGGEKNENNNI